MWEIGLWEQSVADHQLRSVQAVVMSYATTGRWCVEGGTESRSKRRLGKS